ncbi:hypothetical protein Corgl_0019 [Coriobacterium glomerans PW2]|uniref:Uncharacterized protein n=1 Tax=Coriobacterium glomerans (strain ATCC 49209 / DSM 20642 / JCM 10262 / PW2) TaxID=700015 RepID=F2N6V0_CORGP|nr:hypothetical protein [Coriobacterium glomerans]AEB06149.1 hypothetical protein Corgl_0019 [Coriobacterium glomerans PW2]
MISRGFRGALVLERTLEAGWLALLAATLFFAPRLDLLIIGAVVLPMIALTLVDALSARCALSACAILDRDLDPARLLAETAKPRGMHPSLCMWSWLHVAHRRALALALTGDVAGADRELDLLERVALRAPTRSCRAAAAALGYHAASVALDAERAERLWSTLAGSLRCGRDPLIPRRPFADALLQGRSRIRALVAAGRWGELAALQRRAADTDRTALGRLLGLRGLAVSLERSGDAAGAALTWREIAEAAGGLTGLADQARAALAGGPAGFSGDGDYPVPAAISAVTAPPRPDEPVPSSASLGIGLDGFERALRACGAMAGCWSGGRSRCARTCDALVASGVALNVLACAAVVAYVVVELVSPAGAAGWAIFAVLAAALLHRLLIVLYGRRLTAMLTRSCDPAALLAETEDMGSASWQRLPAPIAMSFRGTVLAWMGRGEEGAAVLRDLQDMRFFMRSTRGRLICSVCEIQPSEATGDVGSMLEAMRSTEVLLGSADAPLTARLMARSVMEGLSRAAAAECIGTIEARLAWARGELAGRRLSPLQEVSLRRAEALLLDELAGGFSEGGEADAGRPDAAVPLAEALRDWAFVAERGGTTPWVAEARARLAAPSAAAAGLRPYRRPLLLEVWTSNPVGSVRATTTRSRDRRVPAASHPRRRLGCRIGCGVLLLLLALPVALTIRVLVTPSDATDRNISIGIRTATGGGPPATDGVDRRTYATPAEALRASGLFSEDRFVSDPLVLREDDTRASVMFFVASDKDGRWREFNVVRMERRDGRYVLPKGATSFSYVDTAMGGTDRYPTPEAKAGNDIVNGFFDNTPTPAVGLQWFGASADPRVGEMTVLGRRPDGVVRHTYEGTDYYCWYYDDLDVIGALRSRRDFSFDNFTVGQIVRDLKITFPRDR